MGAKPGPATILSEEEEDALALYHVEMADMGFGLSRETVIELAHTIVVKSGRNPFRGGKAGHSWLERFHRHHPHLSLRPKEVLI